MTSDPKSNDRQHQSIENVQDQSFSLKPNGNSRKIINPGVGFLGGKVQAQFKASQFLILSLLGKANRAGVLSHRGLFELKMAKKKILVHLKYELPKMFSELSQEDSDPNLSTKDQLERYQITIRGYLRDLDRFTHPQYRQTIQSKLISSSLSEIIRSFKSYIKQVN